MPPKKRKFESTFPAARIKKIMQLDNDVGRVASSVPVVISRAVEIFLHALLTRAAHYATSRNAKTLTVSHLKYSINQEKQWDFLKELTAKIPDVNVGQDNDEESSGSKRGRKRRASPSQSKPPGGKRKQKKKLEQEASESDSGSNSPEPSIREENRCTVSEPGVREAVSHHHLPQYEGESSMVPSIALATAGLQQTISSTQDSQDEDYDDDS